MVCLLGHPWLSCCEQLTRATVGRVLAIPARTESKEESPRRLLHVHVEHRQLLLLLRRVREQAFHLQIARGATAVPVHEVTLRAVK